LDHEATVYLGNPPWSTTEDDLARLLGQLADVVGARGIQGRRTGCTRGYGFVELAAVEQATRVCATLHACQFNGRRLEVRPVQARAGRW